MNTWREVGEGNERREKGRRKRARGEQETKRAREQRGASSLFYRGSGLPGCCQVTMGRSLDRMLTSFIM